MQFQRLAIVRLCTPDPPAPDTPDDERIGAEHRAYLGRLQAEGFVAANGPVKFRDSAELRGMTIYTVEPDRARALAMDDPAVKAGWFDVVVDEWWLPSRPVTLGDRVDIDVD